MSRLAEQFDGSEYWRSLSELAESPEVREALENEFVGYDPDEFLKPMGGGGDAGGSGDGDDEVSSDRQAVRSSDRRITNPERRGFLKLMGASMALAGLTGAGVGCRRWPKEQILPYAARPDGMTPGVAEFYASMMELGGIAEPMLVRSFDGRPLKTEGNADHPYSRGTIGSFGLATTLEMYDPQRSRSVIERGRVYKGGDWSAFESAAAKLSAGYAENGGEGLAVLSELSGSPTMARLRQRFAERYPKATWTTYEPVNRDHEISGTKLAFGRAMRPVLKLEKAKVVAFFDDDALAAHPSSGRYAKDWASGRRRVDDKAHDPSRTYAIESRYTSTGAAADLRLPVKPSRVGEVLDTVAAALGVAGAKAHAFDGAGESAAHVDEKIELLIDDLLANQGKGSAVVSVGYGQPASVHALAAKVNAALGAIGETVVYLDESEISADADALCVAGISSLARMIEAGDVDTLLMIGGNPAYDAPANLGFAELLAKPATTIHLSDFVNETSAIAAWHLPRAHHLECWGDGRTYDGTVTMQQPLILPLYDGRSPIEVVSMLLGVKAAGYDLVRQTFAESIGMGVAGVGGAGFEPAWRTTIHDGYVKDSAARPASVRPTVGELVIVGSEGGGAAVGGEGGDGGEGGKELELLFVAGGSVYDGRFSNNAWLQEAPDPMTKLTWDRGVLLSKYDADKLGVANDDVVRVAVSGGAAAKLSVYIMPGLARGTAVVELGYGRTHAGSVGDGIGVDVYPLRTTEAMAVVSASAVPATIKKTGTTFRLAATQDHHLIDGIGQWGRTKRTGKIDKSGYVVKEGLLGDYKKDPHLLHRGHHADLSLQLYTPPYETPAKHPDGPTAFNHPHAWGMTIDMNSCIGCNACVVACQSENNIPVVGRKEVIRNREMHWLRIDRYFKTEKGDKKLDDPDTVHMPVACVHCENAPCEQVCPVAATVHDTEGLNTMVYNRCIGTRYCSNNCPYKVRRYNYFDWHAQGAQGRKGPQNPNSDSLPWLNIPDTQQGSVINEIKRMVFNPDVTVRMRGVMEKCTFCVQRIQSAKITAKVENAQGKNGRTDDLVRDGEVVTACQSSCPTDAIIFGDLNDPNSRVSVAKESHRSYDLLAELNTRPRTKHLGRIRNRPSKVKKTDKTKTQDPSHT